MNRGRKLLKKRRVHLYKRKSYENGTRISQKQVAHCVGYLDTDTELIYHNNKLNYDAWISLVNKTKEARGMSPHKAALFVNDIYKNKIHQKEDYSGFVELLRDTCGKWFSVIPTMTKV